MNPLRCYTQEIIYIDIFYSILHIIFIRFGEILEIVEVEDSNSVVLQFKTRREAEMAMAGGKTFGDQLIQVTW